MPIAVKELFDVESADGSYGSMVLAGRRAEDDAAVVASLRRAGAVVVGLTRSHEFGWGITTQHATRGSTHNPWNLDRIPGGSSGGSAAAVAAGIVPLAVASDTGGSIRLPASFCGVFGLKTTPGRISRRGGVPLAPSFDTVGFVARNPSLLASALAATAGPGPGGPAHARRSTARPGRHRRGRRRGALLRARRRHRRSARRPPTAEALDTVATALAELGCRRVEASVPAGPVLYEIFVPYQMAEAYHVHRAILGNLSRAVGALRRRRARSTRGGRGGDDRRLPRRPAPAPPRRGPGSRCSSTTSTSSSRWSARCGPSSVAQPDVVAIDGRDVRLRDAVMPSTVPQNVAGLPSVTVPAGTDADGLPIGVQLAGRPWSEPMLLALAEILERRGACRASVPERFSTGA